MTGLVLLTIVQRFLENASEIEDCVCPAGEDVGHYGGSYKVTYDLYKKYGEMRLLDTPICGGLSCPLAPFRNLKLCCSCQQPSVPAGVIQ